MLLSSYAQNFEDIILYHALGKIQVGSYVDIGAGDPTFNSVTNGFYQLGWRGVNVEPLLQRFTDLTSQRPEDINLRVAVADYEGKTQLFSVEQERGELSTIEPPIVSNLIGDGISGRTVEVGVTTLESIFNDYVTGPVHFLKIDVEGSELAVLRGANFRLHRPWIIVIEVVAGTQKGPYGEITELIESFDYKHVYFDGLNAYFVAAEKHDEVAPNFGLPFRELENFHRPGRETLAIETINLVGELIGAKSQDIQEIPVRIKAFIDDRWAENTSACELIEEQKNQISFFEKQIAHFESLTFSRERQLSFVTAKLASEKWRNKELLSDLEYAQAEVQFKDNAIEEIKQSTSWKFSLPLRVLRRPLFYFSVLISKRSSKHD